MPLERDVFAQKIEEFKEAGHEYRYRIQLMPMVAAAIQVFGMGFLLLTSLHLRNINEDRGAALARKEVLRDELEFAAIHQNPQATRRLSAPGLMVWFARAVAAAWAVWTVASIWSRFQTNILPH
jgi:hypothetical protein